MESELRQVVRSQLHRAIFSVSSYAQRHDSELSMEIIESTPHSDPQTEKRIVADA